MKQIIKHIKLLSLILILCSCKDEKFSFQKIPYTGDELRTNGYYFTSYQTLGTNYIIVNFLFRDGTILSAGSFENLGFNVVEQKLVERYELIRKNKIGWGVFQVIEDIIISETWTTNSGGVGLPVYKWSAKIENDTTFLRNDSNQTWHYKQFSPKPDSTNRFIP